MTNHLEEIRKSIETQIEELPLEEVEELALDSIHFGKFTPEINAMLEKFPNLISLALNDCSLKNLENFPKIPNLIKLELIDNQLTPAALPQIVTLNQLQSLSLGGNNFSNFEELKPLTQLQNLLDLDLFGCKLCEKKEYRAKLFELLPKLEILDNCDKDGKEINDEEDDDLEDDELGEDEDGEDDDDEEEYDEEDGDEDDEDEDEDEDEEEPKPKDKKVKK